jgi:hypothetical protein
MFLVSFGVFRILQGIERKWRYFLWNCNLKEKKHKICALGLEEFIFFSLVTKRHVERCVGDAIVYFVST